MTADGDPGARGPGPPPLEQPGDPSRPPRLAEVIAKAAADLQHAGVQSPRHDAEVLAAHVLGVARGELIAHPGFEHHQAARFAELIARRAAREPLQHITGVAHFREITVRVGPGVFVPRPETEVTAGAAIEASRAVQATGRTPVVVDLFAGSGAIALSIAHEVPGALVHAVEADPGAVTWLRRNAAGTRVIAHRADVAGSSGDCLADLAGKVDVVVANPPYVPLGADVRDPEVVAYDPPLALWSGEDGLDALRVLSVEAARLLRPGGALVAEHADVQGVSAPGVFAGDIAWTAVEDHVDLTGRPRYLTATRAG